MKTSSQSLSLGPTSSQFHTIENTLLVKILTRRCTAAFFLICKSENSETVLTTIKIQIKSHVFIHI